jgi:hypothetical protein
MALGAAGAAHASEIFVNSDITTSTTWTADNTYNLLAAIYVRPGATLTIEPGTVIASTTDIAGGGGALAVMRGARIFAMGSKSKPIIMTSTSDVATWVGGDPKTGLWRESQSEWGNLTIMGRAYISENAIGGNVPTCDPDNVGDMEGLTRGAPDDLYGGGDDEDDSGTIKYVSIRYGGQLVGFNDELNALSLGGVGRETDIHHIDIMNNVDDGIEIWGGTVNIKYANIWNVGDDSFDVDQGWRGKAQFLLIVQGYSTRVAQGSGTGDNAFETDGAEQSDWQPVTTATIYNATVIGQPQGAAGSDHATAWRDNARVQYRNCIFMDIGERLVSFDNVDGDGGAGYGNNGTLTWAATWTTDFDSVPAHANDCSDPATIYQAQTSGKLAEIKDSIFYNNTGPSAYTEATARGVYPPSGTNNNVEVFTMPITALARAAAVNYLTFSMKRVTSIDPLPAIPEAATSVATAPADGFFTPAQYRGAFGCQNWLLGWTAADAYGFVLRPGWQQPGAPKLDCKSRAPQQL